MASFGSYHDSNDYRIDQDYSGTYDMFNRNFSSKRQAQQYKDEAQRKKRKQQEDKVRQRQRQEQEDKRRRKNQAIANQNSPKRPPHPQSLNQMDDHYPPRNLSDINKGLPNFKDCGQCCSMLLVLIALPFFVAYYLFWYLVYLFPILIVIFIGIIEALVIIFTLGFCCRYSSAKDSKFRKAYRYFNFSIRGNWGLVFKCHIGCFTIALIIFIIVIIVLATKAKSSKT